MTDKQEWQRVTLWSGGTVTGVAFSPVFEIDSVALVASPVGIYRSTDGGQQWAWSSSGINDPLVLAVGFAPAPSTGMALAFAGTQGGRLFRSADGGVTWHELTVWAGLGTISSFVFSPHFASDQTFFVTTENGVLRTQDGGQSWEESTFGLHDLHILCLACAPGFSSGEGSQNEILWVGTAAGGFYRSRNAGRSWRDSGTGLPDDALTCLLVSPQFAADQTLYVGTEAAGLYRSTDGGATWALHNADLAAAGTTCLAMTPEHCLLLGTGAGLYGSEDRGHTWNLAAGGEFIPTMLAIAPDGTWLAGTLDSGVCRSMDGGRSWQPVNAGLAAHAPPVVSRSGQQVIFALDNQGWLAAYQPGEAWMLLNPAETIGALTAFALVDTVAATTIFAASAAGHLWQANLNGDGAEWVQVATAATEQLFPILVSAQRPEQEPLLYLADQNGWLYRYQNADLRTVNQDVPWLEATLLSLTSAPGDATGQTLLAISTTPTAVGHAHLQLWQSHDGGQGWEKLAALESEIPAVAIALPVDPQEQALFVATRHRVIKLFYQVETGVLTSTQSFLDANLNITALAASPTFIEDQTLWAATTHGVYQSTDGGDTWQAVGSALHERCVVAIFAPTTATSSQAVTLGGELWQLA